MVSQMILQMMFVLSYKWTLWTLEYLILLDVAPSMIPEFCLLAEKKFASIKLHL